MARVRLFANLREMAGAATVELPGSTVGEVLDTAEARYGRDFALALQGAQVWVDGERVGREAAVGANAEVAVIPPVSGGTYVVQSPIALEVALVLASFGALILGNALSLEWFTVLAVLVSSVWVLDITGATDRRGLPLANAIVVLAVAGGAVGTYRYGAIGMAAAVGGAVLGVLAASVFRNLLRPIDSFVAGVVLALVAALGSSALVALRLRSEDETRVFLAVLTVAVIVSWVSDRAEMPLIDPLVGLLLGAVLAGAVGGALWAPDLLAAVGASVAAAIALVAGRNLGSLLRAGGFFTQGSIPGSLAFFDGALLAAGAFWGVLTILS